MHPAILILLLVGPAVGIVSGALLGARLWRSQERLILGLVCLVAGVVFIGGICGSVAMGGNAAHLTIRNETPWPVAVNATNITGGEVPSNGAQEFTVSGGPGWINGYIDDVQVFGGPTMSTRIIIRGLDGGESMTVTITEAMLGSEPNASAP